MIATLILIILYFVELGIHIGRDGQKIDKYYDYKKQIAAIMIVFALYYFAGLFDKFLFI